MSIEIQGLYENTEKGKVVEVYRDAFRDYPKLKSAFPKEETRQYSLEATIWYYAAFDMKYGKIYSLDSDVNEAVSIIETAEMNYSKERLAAAGSCDQNYITAMNAMTEQERQLRDDLFDEIDRLEDEMPLPRPHIYINFLGVKSHMQHKGRGRILMNKIIEYSREIKVPLVLFTNTAEDVKFYESLGFVKVGIATSEKFGFVNTYMTMEY